MRVRLVRAHLSLTQRLIAMAMRPNNSFKPTPLARLNSGVRPQMKHIAPFVVLISSVGLAACTKQHVCPVWFVAEEADTGTAQRVTVALENALRRSQDFRLADTEEDGGATFVLTRAALADRNSDEIELTYEARGRDSGDPVRRVVSCGAQGDTCMDTVLVDLRAQCGPGA